MLSYTSILHVQPDLGTILLPKQGPQDIFGHVYFGVHNVKGMTHRKILNEATLSNHAEGPQVNDKKPKQFKELS